MSLGMANPKNILRVRIESLVFLMPAFIGYSCRNIKNQKSYYKTFQ